MYVNFQRCFPRSLLCFLPSLQFQTAIAMGKREERRGTALHTWPNPRAVGIRHPTEAASQSPQVQCESIPEVCREVQAAARTSGSSLRSQQLLPCPGCKKFHDVLGDPLQGKRYCPRTMYCFDANICEMDGLAAIKIAPDCNILLGIPYKYLHVKVSAVPMLSCISC